MGWSVGIRDGVHLNEQGQARLSQYLGNALLGSKLYQKMQTPAVASQSVPGIEKLASLIKAKNQFWFDYWRVQNWAFLAGDRTNQPSSRDWQDPSKRWFPAEREEFIPLVEAKEKEIDALAAKLK